jgi:hypothetical protein
MSGETVGVVRGVLRLEGACVLIAALLVYSNLGYSWGTFALYFLVPDLSLLGYLISSRFGAITYNLAHSYMGAVICLVTGVLLPSHLLQCAGLIWCAHIGFDRALGYGLKYATGFSYTHLGRIGKFALTKSTEPKWH